MACHTLLGAPKFVVPAVDGAALRWTRDITVRIEFCEFKKAVFVGRSYNPSVADPALPYRLAMNSLAAWGLKVSRHRGRTVFCDNHWIFSSQEWCSPCSTHRMDSIPTSKCSLCHHSITTWWFRRGAWLPVILRRIFSNRIFSSEWTAMLFSIRRFFRLRSRSPKWFKFRRLCVKWPHWAPFC